mmetsp:Transcript_13260/g.21953  ORF Transcript_13260/g.21953 Transcript_13260/m.21953 type:complete len:225 (-) Transcript_13260:40-714(-)|eukprot:CAMPEP_0119006058 /NCGR_PEP_ID=MMETSP1176-20130426/2093_1 /TAXON_ID=265551 /ORGANISM="Synedropsis recta cf, Strain CCMP1620" /LENGTH=224 /DNA_ID=CAMNT_0006957945 /DNA_START=47 /DNA_END=721 /DNA_ORIENTATION=+
MSEEDQLQEYESQLADIEELLQADPNDESMLKLKSDLVELIALTKEDEEEGGAATTEEVTTAASTIENPLVETTVQQWDTVVGTETAAAPPLALTIPAAAAAATMTVGSSVTTTSGAEPPKKKLKKVKDFETPAHLQIQEGDNEKEVNRKKRATKALKQKHRAKKIDYESTKKQQSWQNFSKKKGSKKKKSIFATQDGVQAKVGVVSGGSMTEYGERKRHKYED